MHPLTLLWAAFFAYWRYAAMRVKPSQRAESAFSRFTHMGLMALAFILTLTDYLRIGPLGLRFLPPSAPAPVVGALVSSFGMALAVLARRQLGEYWSGTVAIKEEHRLVRSGPYAFVRHPIYTGMLLGIVGTAIVVGEVRGLVAVLLMLIASAQKTLLEERWLLEELGDEYALYRREVRALIPYLW